MTAQPMEGFRLSPGQRRLWHLTGADGAEEHRTHGVLLLPAGTTLAAVQAALTALTARHEVLRTRLERFPGVALPVQVIDDEAAVTVAELDAGAASEGEAAAAALLALAEAAAPAPAGPCWWAGFAQGADGVPRLALAFPGALLDPGSLDVLAAELTRELSGTPPGEEAMQYADLSEWLNELAEGEDGAEGRAFWKATGLPADPSWELPGARRTPAAKRSSARVAVTVAPHAIAAAAERDGADREAWLLALWQLFLARFSGQEGFVIGVERDGRGYDELALALGLFARALPLWTEVDLTRSLPAAAASVARSLEEHATWLESFSWEALGAESSAATPAFAAGFAYREPGPQVAALSGGAEPAGLALLATARGDETLLELAYDGARLDAAWLERLAAALATLVEHACAEPAAELGALSLVSADERTFLLGPASTTPRGRVTAGPNGAPPARTAHELVARACRENPTACAAVGPGGALTYGELDRRANALAARLVALGVGPDVRVALCLERSPALLVGLHGILRAGGGYVPIDPGYPEERARFLLEDSGAQVLVTTRAVLTRLPARPAEVVVLEDLAAAGADAAPPVAVGPEHLAYVIYTSGSTGKPKGVEVTHGNLVHSTTARFERYPESPARFLLVSSFAFDSSVTGLFWTLATGGTLVLPRDGDERDARVLVGLIEEHAVTCSLLLPSLHGLLLEQPEPARLGSLRDVLVAGEACSRELVERHHTSLPATRLWNEYGPTENTVWSTVHDCAELPAEGSVPIGRPVPGVVVRVLDERRALLPAGAAGELYVGGPGVARGYLARPELTAERFVADPFGPAGERLYRTGDRVRLGVDGVLSFLGRVDHQVKVRGYRVELEEIEAVFGAQPDVAEACVVAREEEAGARLVAYLVPRGGELAVDRVLAGLRERLPEYMVPSACVVLADLPRTPNGKVDRKALPAPDEAGGRAGLSSEYVAPGDALEEAVAGVWADVLGVGEVGVEDNFFELGGHSILAVRLVTRMGESFQVDVGLRQLFDAPTIRGLLGVLRAEPEGAAALDRAAELLERLLRLSDDEVAARLEERA